MTGIKLRDYQREAIDAVFAAWADGMQRPAIVLPTGAGKTVVFASLIKRWREDFDPGDWYLDRGKRVIVLAHRDELVDQAIAKIRAIAPDLNVGKVKAEDDQIGADVMVCSVQTLGVAKRRAALVDAQEQFGPVGLIITDECHHAAAMSYQLIYHAFPDALQLGVTATMARGDKQGLGKVWEAVVYKRSILNLISKGHLTDVRTIQVDLKALDMGGVNVSRGDYAAGDLGRALMEAEADTAIVRAYKEHAGRRQGIVFTPTVETAVAATMALSANGIAADMVSGETSREERQRVYEDFRKGRRQVLVNCMVLTEGFDAPWAEVAVIARPTQSAPLYTQMVGRVLRPWPGKKEALVLDLVGASASRLRTLIDLEEPGAVRAIRDGESLAEAVVREAEEDDRKIPAGSVAFELKSRDVGAFGASDHTWIRSPAGVMFIDCGASEHGAKGSTRVFLWPSTSDKSDTWDVCVSRTGKPWERTEHTGLDIGSAMAWGESVSEDQSVFSTAKSARWRKEKPSTGQLAIAVSLGIPEADSMRRGELSDAISRELGGRVFDRFVR